MTETTDPPELPAAKSDTPITDEAAREVLGKADRLNAEEWQRKFGMLINRMAQMERQLKSMNGNAIAADSNLLDFAYPTLEAFEQIVGYKVNDTFKDGWRMARTTNAQLGITPNTAGDSACYRCATCGLELLGEDVGEVAAGAIYTNGEHAPCPERQAENPIDRD